MNKDTLLKERQTRIDKAIALDRPDRVPVIVSYALWAATVTGVPFPEFCVSVEKSGNKMIEAFELCGGADGLEFAGFSAYGNCFVFMSKVRVPGIDLPDDSHHQVAEMELMKIEDYDTILDMEWPEFYMGFLKTRVLDDVNPAHLPMSQPPFNAKAICDPLGIPLLTGGMVSTPYEMLCGARSLPKFMHDLFTIPDKVEAVMEHIVPHLSGLGCQMAKANGLPCVWVGGWRTASAMLSPKLWDRFAWPYFKRLVNEVVDAGLIAILHMDQDWTRDLARFRELPKGRCIMSLDGATDIFKAKEIIGDHMCIMGDVPAAKFSHGTPDEVHDYCMKLISEIGPEGFILHSGCDIPANAKLENVKAMVYAATGK
ncbi:MAG: uroporphyrinogen decarboxylase [Deltaproteobacteria bacterium]|nr:uroporphyrinogen decarboxylase [Deltaproteobacteria bacterium]MBW2143470.1 uroporphyrinogen decarboxylase [Deltaproteobacteria bacterium]